MILESVYLEFEQSDYWHKDNEVLLSMHVDQVVLPKKGKYNKQGQEEEGRTKSTKT